MATLTYAPAQESDIHSIQQAAGESWRATYAGIFAPQFIEEFLASAYRTEALRRVVANPTALFLVAREAERVVGFAHAGRRGDEWELFRLYVVPDRWRQGIGGQLLALVEDGLRERGASDYFCFVHQHNERGKAFYDKVGFAHELERDEEDAWFMQKFLVALVET